jgi:type I restriction enzyme S subunit
MTTIFKPYPKSKPSGAEWLGDIPEHWILKRIGQVFRERKETVSDKEYPPLSVTKHGIVPQMETVAKTDAGEKRKKICKGDFAINSRSDRKGSSGVSPLDGSTSAITIVLEPMGINPAYAHHLLRSYGFQEEFYRWGKGIVADLWSTRFSDMKSILVPIPPADEATIISGFLDAETKRIDEIIRRLGGEELVRGGVNSEKRSLGGLLKEYRSCLIHEAVTGKIDLRKV